MEKYLFYSLEKSVYKNHKNINYNIEAVSDALKEYLKDYYRCPGNIIKIAEIDIPKFFEPVPELVAV